MLRGDRATVLSGVKAERNGDNGVLVSGDPGSRPITGISTTGNKAYGVSVIRSEERRGPRPDPVRRQAGGLELNRTTDSKVRDVTATDEPNGVFLHVNSANVLAGRDDDHRRAHRHRGGEDHEEPAGHRIDDRQRPRRGHRDRRQGHPDRRPHRQEQPHRRARRARCGRRHRQQRDPHRRRRRAGHLRWQHRRGGQEPHHRRRRQRAAQPELGHADHRRHDPRWPHRDGPAGGHDRQRHPGRAHHHRHPRPGGRADRARRP